jgi:hypothetical protein
MEALLYGFEISFGNPMFYRVAWVRVSAESADGQVQQ